MLPLTEPQMRQFIENRLPGRAESLLSQLKDRLRELAETPLLLKILCDVVQDSPDGQLPQNRGELFQKSLLDATKNLNRPIPYPFQATLADSPPNCSSISPSP